jgi:tRNA A-37 threonylcarbamoyl transferase component Bud32
MSMGCCILLADSKYRLWFRSLMKPMVEYVPIKSDLSDLIEKIKWCRVNDKACKKIAKNAKKFYLHYLQKDGALDYLQKIVIDLKKQSGIYFYNTETPLTRQIRLETKLDLTYPHTDKTIADIGMIPRQARSIGVLKGMEWIINMVNKESTFTDVAKKGAIVFTNRAKTVMVQKYSLAGFSFIIKASTDRMKQQENIHEAYIGTKVINEIVKYIPNFAYVFGKFDGPTKNIVIMEHIHGHTFDKWLQSDKFNMQDYLFILIQLAMALEVAQNQGGFVHYDLTPWNIIIQEIPRPIGFDYMLDGTNVFRVTTTLIPVIIDYGKSHVIHENEHHGYINMYKTSTIHDIISILLTSLNIVCQRRNLPKKDIISVVKLANFMSGTGYRRKEFKAKGDVQHFISRAKKYEEMISSDKHELELQTPRDFIKYINKVFTYNFTYEKIDFPTFRINRGNPRQVFEYVLASSQEEKTQSFIDVFNRVVKCDFPNPVNLFFAYYAAQTLEENVTSVHKLMLHYLKMANLEDSGKKYKKAMKKIRHSYRVKLSDKSDEKVVYDLSQSFKSLEISSYTEETFLLPDVVLKLLSKYGKLGEDLSEYKNIIEHVFLNQGMFKMTDEHREYYLENFADLLTKSSVNMKTYIANVHTLRGVARGIYTTDMKILSKKLQKKKSKKRNCDSAEKYMLMYNKVEEFFKKNDSGSSQF